MTQVNFTLTILHKFTNKLLVDNCYR